MVTPRPCPLGLLICSHTLRFQCPFSLGALDVSNHIIQFPESSVCML